MTIISQFEYADEKYYHCFDCDRCGKHECVEPDWSKWLANVRLGQGLPDRHFCEDCKHWKDVDVS